MLKNNMRFWCCMLCLLLFPVLAAAKEVEIGVQGMVCSFCAQGIEKKFKAQPAVKKVKVDLEKKIVFLSLHEGKDLDEKTIHAIIKDAGYKVLSIEMKKE